MDMRFDKGIYSLEALLKASYHFLDDAYIHLAQDDSDWIVSWICKDGATITQNEFGNELISQQLRYQIVERTAEVRKLMLARAYASTLIDVRSEQTEEENDDDSNTTQDDILKDWYDANGNI